MNLRSRKATRLTVSLDATDAEALEQIAQQKDVSLSWVIRQAVREFARRELAASSNSAVRSDAGSSS